MNYSEFNNDTFIENKVDRDGGAIVFFGYSKKSKILNSHFEGNEAYSGGAIHYN